MHTVDLADLRIEHIVHFNNWGSVPMVRVSHPTTRKTRTYNNGFHPEHERHWTKKLRVDIEAGAFN
jgi:hypothetical protein